MAWLLFVDESGHDREASPYEVLAGIAIHDSRLWTVINELHDAELRNFGCRYSEGARELKGTKILKTKVFRHVGLNASVTADEIAALATFAMTNGARCEARHLRALAQAKINYVRDVFTICARHGCRVFASMVETDAHPTTSNGLRKDYAYLFQRFFYFLEDHRGEDRGIIVFDELEKTKSHLLIDQAHRYFRDSATGRHRASLIIPEPFFVHSDLTTGVQIADLVAYILSWGFRTNRMTKPRRAELLPYANQIAALRYRTERRVGTNAHFEIWSIAHITDLRTNMERELEEQ